MTWIPTELFDYRALVSVVAVILAVVGYLPYIRKLLERKVTPHAFTWFTWSVPGFIAFELQVYGGGGAGVWPLFAGSALCFIIFMLSLRQGRSDITKLDVLFLALSIFSLYLWLVVEQPVWSAVLITAVELFGFMPTIRKSWANPYSEHLFTYQVLTARHVLSIFAMSQLNLLTALYPVALALADAAFILMLVMRRKQMGASSPHSNSP